MNSTFEPYVEVLQAALNQRSSILIAGFKHASRTLQLGTSARALGRLAVTVRGLWLHAWVTRLREQANNLERFEFTIAPLSSGGGDQTSVQELVLESKDGRRVTLLDECPQWLTTAHELDPQRVQLRQITGLLWDSAEMLQNFLVELRELCLTLHSTALCEHATRHLVNPPLSPPPELHLRCVSDGSVLRYILPLR